MKLTRITFGFLLVLLGFPTSFLLFADASGGETEEVNPVAQWSTGGTEFAQFTVPFDGATPEQIYGTETFREDGYLPLSNTTDYRLAYLDRNANKLIATPYMVSKMITSIGCTTSQCQTTLPALYAVNGKALVSQDGDWYLYDFTRQTKELWFDATAAGLSETNPWQAIAVKDQVYVYQIVANAETQSNEPLIYWMPKKNTTERIYEIPAGFQLGKGSQTLQPEMIASIGISETLGMFVTDYIGYNKAVVGQIGNGVYVEKSGTYMKLGSTEIEPTTYGSPLPFWKTVPLAVWENVMWIGADNALSVAHLDLDGAGLTATGIQDVPRNVPFREQSSSAVYIENGPSYTNTNLYVYKNAEEYTAAQNDPTFSKVIWVNDGTLSQTQIENAI